MELRWFSTCDKFGVWTQPSLQYWDNDIKMWEDLPLITCKDEFKEEYLRHKPTTI